ncbi:MAG: trypsin-like peptidase domain-containing protein [Acidaminococcales bacterium]|nr:trypsin-like peptidase domain-containing protein [Acidaminococcales bacterium]
MNALKRLLSQSASILTGMAIGVFVLGCGLAAPGIINNNAAGYGQDINSAKAQPSISAARNTPVVRAAQRVAPAVVGIANKGYIRDFFSGRKVIVDRGQGSGVIFDQSGLIVTNNHVVEDAQELVISLIDGRTFPGRVLGTDPATDLAVVKIEGGKDLPVAQFGNSSEIVVGEPAIAIGNPLDMEFRGSVTLGVISALNRTLEIGDQRYQLLQTDAAINPGNSGGALVNADGLVIGINSAKINYAGVEGMGFAIPIDAVKPIVKDLIEKGKVTRPYLGVNLLDSKTAAFYYGYRFEKGLLISRALENSPAAKAGLRQGDIIVKVNGVEVNRVVELRAELNKLSVGQTAELSISRDGRLISVAVALEKLPD